MIKQIGLPLRSRPILLITRMITDRIGLHSVLLPLLIIIIIVIIIIIIIIIINSTSAQHQRHSHIEPISVENLPNLLLTKGRVEREKKAWRCSKLNDLTLRPASKQKQMQTTRSLTAEWSKVTFEPCRGVIAD